MANVFGRLPMIVLLTLVEANGLRIAPAMTVGLTTTNLLMLAAWLWYVRERPGAARARTTAPLPGLGRTAAAPLAEGRPLAGPHPPSGRSERRAGRPA